VKYGIEVKKSVAKELKQIARPDQKRIIKAIDNPAENLPNPDITKMKGNNPFHKIRVGDYRIIYEIQNDILMILIIKIGHLKPSFPWPSNKPMRQSGSRHRNCIV
jgi:mRNA interferase RelE/StbE